MGGLLPTGRVPASPVRSILIEEGGLEGVSSAKLVPFTDRSIQLNNTKQHYLFAYGTLRRGGGSMHRLLIRGGELVGRGYICGQVYDIDGYPGAIETGPRHAEVAGEIYLLADPKRLLARLDEYEQCTQRFPSPHEYARKLLPVRMENNQRLEAWVYLYNWPLKRRRAIPGGDYVRYLTIRGRRR